MYASVIIDISHEKIDRPFQYSIPKYLEGEELIGREVVIPFGAGNTRRSGYVIDVTRDALFDASRTKSIIDVNKSVNSIEQKMISLAYFIRKRYGCTMIDSLRIVLSAKKRVRMVEKKTVTLVMDKETAIDILVKYKKKNQVAKARVVEKLLEDNVASYEVFTKELKVATSTLSKMVEEGVIEIASDTKFRKPTISKMQDDKMVKLSEEQQLIVDEIKADRESGDNKNYYIHGITGSGKTEVYLRLIEDVIAEGKQAIVLIPEIALTLQTASRFEQRFKGRVSIINSRLSDGEKQDQLIRAMNGEVDVIIGPRSALFTPFPNLGIIIIDEEHESSYRSDKTPRYDAREVAMYYAKLTDSSVVLASATPSMEMYYMVKNGELKLYELTKRLTGEDLPKVYVEDMRDELRSGNRSMFSNKLYGLIEDRLNKKEQTMLFINRRGYSGFLSCRACGYIMKCPHCDISLNKHSDGIAKCHYCGYKEVFQHKCPSCGSRYLYEFKGGTQQVVSYIEKEFPLAKVLRMDADTTAGKNQYEEILQSFSNHEADILVGTQMIIKGHDFKGVTLVGIVAADISLGGSDYKSGERTFQILTQAAGRAGRGDKSGEVVIQTYQPQHYSVVYAKNHNFKKFYEEEIQYRQLMKYPPISQLMAILIMSKDESRARVISEEIVELTKDILEEYNAVRIGPSEASIYKLKDFFRYVLYIKDSQFTHFTDIKDLIEEKVIINANKEVIIYDFNPIRGY